MIQTVLFLAAYLHAPVDLVEKVYVAGGIDAVAVVQCESHFNVKALRKEPRGYTSFGIFQLDDQWHNQHRDNLDAHIRTGVAFLADCKARSKTLAGAIQLYNGSLAWGRAVEKKRDELARYVAWRTLREMEAVHDE